MYQVPANEGTKANDVIFSLTRDSVRRETTYVPTACFERATSTMFFAPARLFNGRKASGKRLR